MQEVLIGQGVESLEFIPKNNHQTTSSMSNDNEDKEEAKHFNSCVRGFLEYGQWLAPEFERRAQHVAKLSKAHVELLGGSDVFSQRQQTALNCLSSNASFLAKSIQHHITHSMQDSWAEQERIKRGQSKSSHSHSHSHGHGHGQDGACDGNHGNDDNGEEDHREHPQLRLAPERHMVKVRSTLKQCVRDWSSLGKSERDSCYAPLIQALQTHLPAVTTENFGQQKVLVPGSGLGRLVFDLASMGYDTQGNEFSYFMLLMGDYIMNKSSGKDCHTVYPWLGESCNMMSREEEFESVSFPDVYPGEVVRNAPGQVNMSVAAGEFLMCYGSKENDAAWDAIATCFFIDTAPNIIDYIEGIWKMLKPNGIWTNIGPLEYHWMTFRDGDIYENDPRFRESIELAYEDIKSIMLKIGFEFLHEERKECLYSTRKNAMKKTLFDCIHFTVKKTTK